MAIASIQKQGGTVEFPVPDAAYLRHLYGEAGPNDAYPQQGSIPNRFKATTAQVPAGFHPEWVTQAVQAAWLALADARVGQRSGRACGRCHARHLAAPDTTFLGNELDAVR